MADKEDFGTDNNINDEELVFHYKKGSFRDREDPLYRSIALGEKKVGKGLIGTLVSTKPNKIMFLTLVALTAFVFLWGFISGPVNSVKIDEVIFEGDYNKYQDLVDKLLKVSVVLIEYIDILKNLDERKLVYANNKI
jgi:hypothetical protein